MFQFLKDRGPYGAPKWPSRFLVMHVIWQYGRLMQHCFQRKSVLSVTREFTAFVLFDIMAIAAICLMHIHYIEKKKRSR